ncbi:MAG: FHA domain-containing protein [Myxococcota bacterium]
MSSAAGQPQREIVLVAVEGEIDPGMEYAVPADRPLAIGRSARGLQIPDPLVSIHHARISYHIRRGYVIEDLESATGTWVDEECIKGGSRPIGVGTVLRFGSTVFEVVPSNRVQPWMQAVAAISAGMLLFAILVFVGMSLVTPNNQSVKLGTPQNRKVRCNAEEVTSVDVPKEFRRQRGIAVEDMSIQAVTDHDKNGCDELWLRVEGHRTLVVTFGTTLMDWKVLGDFPSLCKLPSRLPQDEHLPSVGCSGTRWYMPEGGDRYQIFEHDGVVVFYRPVATGMFDFGAQPAKAKAKAKGKKAKRKRGEAPEPEPAPRARFAPRVEVGRFTLDGEPAFSQFLVERGVTAPIHYLLCESAFADELDPQVLLDHEATQGLNLGCLGQLNLETREGALEGDPIAIAFTETGRRALVDDLTTFFSGDPEGLFLNKARRNQIDQYRRDPGELRGSIKLFAETMEPAPPVKHFDFVPDIDTHIVSGPHQLIEHVRNTKGAAPRSRTYTLTKSTPYVLPTPGCAELRLKVHDFTSEGWETMVPFTFLEAAAQGCSPKPVRLFRAGYSALGRSVHDAVPSRIGGLNARAVVETTATGKGVEVLRARLAVRDPKDVPPKLNQKASLPTPGQP